MKITLRMLRSRNACDHHVNLFIETFGTEAEVTRENLEKAFDTELEMSWFVKLVRGAGRREAFREELDGHFAAFDRAVEAAHNAYWLTPGTKEADAKRWKTVSSEAVAGFSAEEIEANWAMADAEFRAVLAEPLAIRGEAVKQAERVRREARIKLILMYAGAKS